MFLLKLYQANFCTMGWYILNQFDEWGTIEVIMCYIYAKWKIWEGGKFNCMFDDVIFVKWVNGNIMIEIKYVFIKLKLGGIFEA